MKKLVVFDLDNTLAKVGKGISRDDVDLLKKIEKNGMRIAICSGKPAFYLCGLMRQIELDAPILIGENGAIIQFGVELPPKKYYEVPYDEAAVSVISRIKSAIDEQFPDMWYQPNEVGLTPFPKSEEEFEWIQRYIDRNKCDITSVEIFRHSDSYDIVPLGLNKRAGLEYLGNMMGITKEEMIAVGDGVNDYPMFQYAGLAIGIQVAENDKVDHNFDKITDALKFILSRIS